MKDKQYINSLIKAAISAREYSYAPYSNYKVGAAILSLDGSIFTGCNVENSSYSVTNCAERTALFKAVSEGKREFEAIAIVGGKDDKADFAFPCGTCRQALLEFTEADKFTVIVAKAIDDYKVMKLSELIPYGFGSDNLKE